jgi:hypothetical protein
MQKSISEILEQASKIDKRYGRLKHLQENSSAALKAVLGFCFDPKIKWLLPEGAPPYKAADTGEDLQGVLYSEYRRLWIFVESVEYKDLRQMKREQLFSQFLEGLDPDDAKLIISIKDGKMPYKGITKPLVAEAFPNLAKDWDPA